MKNTRYIFAYSILCILSLVLISCSVENGQDGAIGPQGPAGSNGIDGQDGNANVIASDWLDIPGDVFSGVAEMNISLSEITSENINTSVLLVYARTSSFPEDVWPQGQTTLLPVVIRSNIDVKLQMDYFFTMENLTIRYWQSPFLEFISFPSDTQFRYVIIPSLTSPSGKNNRVDYHKMSYAEVMDFFDLPL